jgi:glycine dehydrogenase subunit 1
MDVSNASHYDGASAAAEAVSMAYAHFRSKRNKVILSPGVNPQYRDTIRTYNHGTEIQLIGDSGQIPISAGPEALIPFIDDHTALVMVQYPDFLGRIYDYSSLAEAVHASGALLAVSVNPTALGILCPG